VLTITASEGGTTNPAPGTHTYQQGTTVTVTAQPSGSNKFDYWLLDGQQKTTNPITVIMNTDHTLKAVFKIEQQPGGELPW